MKLYPNTIIITIKYTRQVGYKDKIQAETY